MRIAAIRALFANRNYAIYMSGNFLSLLGTWIQAIAFGWLVWEMTRSPFWVGVVSTVGVIPTLMSGLIGGVLADRMDRLRLIALTQALCFLLTFGFFVLYGMDALNIWLIILFKVALSAIIAASHPARMALIPALVGRERVASAISFGSMTFNLARMVGPAIAGFIIVHGGLGLAFLFNALSYLAMSVAIACLRLERPPAASGHPHGKRPGLWRELRSSIGYVREHAGVLTLFVLALVTFIGVQPISDFLPAIVSTLFKRGVEGVAILTSSLAAGSFAGALWTAGRDAKGLTASALLACGGYALCIAAFVWSDHFWIGCGALAVAGFFTVAFTTAVQTLIQVSVADEVRGRVLSLWFILSRTGPDIGALVIGTVATFASLRAGFTIGVVLCLAASLWAWRRRTTLAPTLEAFALGPDSKPAR